MANSFFTGFFLGLGVIITAIMIGLLVHAYVSYRRWNTDTDIIGDNHPFFPNAEYGFWHYIRFEYWR